MSHKEIVKSTYPNAAVLANVIVHSDDTGTEKRQDLILVFNDRMTWYPYRDSGPNVRSEDVFVVGSNERDLWRMASRKISRNEI